MFVIAGVTGNTGSVVAETLLAQGKPVRVIVRDEAKGAPWKARGTEVAVAKLDDAKGLAAALAGADGAYLLLPPSYTSTDNIADRRRYVDAFVEAIPASGVKHVVFLSSIGAQHADGTGIIRTTHDAETRIGKLASHATKLTFVRAAYFVENWASVLAPVKGDGVLPAFFDEKTKIPMVSTQDIGRTAARALLDGQAAPGVLELAGPVDHSPEDVAAAFAKILGRPVKTVRVPEAGMVPALTAAGLTEDLSKLFAEMNVGIDRGRVAWQRQGAREVRGTVALEETLASLAQR